MCDFLAKCCSSSQSTSHAVTAGLLVAVLFAYAITTFCWIWTLQQGSLARFHPWMALAFVLVSMLRALFLGDRPTSPYSFGMSLILAGMAIVVRS